MYIDVYNGDYRYILFFYVVILKISDDDVNKAEIPKGANQEGR